MQCDSQWCQRAPLLLLDAGSVPDTVARWRKSIVADAAEAGVATAVGVADAIELSETGGSCRLARRRPSALCLRSRAELANLWTVRRCVVAMAFSSLGLMLRLLALKSGRMCIDRRVCKSHLSSSNMAFSLLDQGIGWSLAAAISSVQCARRDKFVFKFCPN